ncbi:MAG TPA: argininosuccinate lyase [Acidimicrobiia bacterium]|nr:argininosuccinate lyase [Acidimicrobiia bacterium]
MNSSTSDAPKPGSTLYDGRLSVETSKIFSAYVDSIDFDIVLAPYDVLVSRAHVKMLLSTKIVDEATCTAILDGLDTIDREISSGEFQASLVPTDEDVHTAIERRLTEIAGDAGRALHTGRSRNDLAQMSGRLYTRDAVTRLTTHVEHLVLSLCNLASKNIDILFPGKTHLQHAQPILLSHWIMSHASRLMNDRERLMQAYERINICVLGSGALAGSTLPLDSEFVSRELGCTKVVDNSIFGVSTRDYITEALFVCAQIVTNLSCLGEDIVWMTSTECGYATLDDQFSSGSSMMPQKKNPDIAELVRGKAGLSIGALTAALAATKSQTFGFNHDLQVDKEALFGAVKDCELSIVAMDAMMETTVFNKEACENSLANQPLTLATDIAEMMVTQGVPFRIAYKAVATCIRSAIDAGLHKEELSQYLRDDEQIGSAATEVLGATGSDILDAMRRSIERRATPAGTSSTNVAAQIAQVTESLNLSS